MTVVVGVSNIMDGFVVADCRLSWVDADVRADVCQKLFLANAWSIVGFSGDLCLGRDLVKGLVNRLRDTRYDDPGWLNDDDDIRSYIAGGLASHSARNGPKHDRCQQEKASSSSLGWTGLDPF